MNPRWNRPEISCDGKDKLTPGRAHQVADDMRRRGRKGIQPYHCVHCSQWHVGNRMGALPDKRKA